MGLIVLLAALQGDVQLVSLVAVHAGHGAGDDLGQGHIGPAAVLHVQDQVAGGDLIVEHHVGEVHAGALGILLGVDGAVVLQSGLVEGQQLVLVVVAGHLGQGLLGVQHVLGDAVVVVVDDLNSDALHVEGVLVGIVAAVANQLGGLGGVVAVAVVDVVLGVLVHVHAGAVQHVVALVGAVSGGDNGVQLVVGGNTDNLGVGQDGGLLHIQSHGLAHVLHGGAHVEGDGVGDLHALLHAGVGGGGVIPHHVLQDGLALAQGGVGVGLLQLRPLVARHNAFHADDAVHGAQDGAVVLIGQSVAVLVLLDHLHVQGVVDQQSRVVAVQSLSHVLGEVPVDAQAGRQSVGVDLPVGANQTLNLRIVADGHQQHLRGLGAGHAGVGIKDAVAAAGNDAGGVAVVDVALGPVIDNVSQAGVHILVQSPVVGAVVLDGRNHLRHLGTVHALGRRIGTIGLALDDAQRREHGNRILVHDLSAVGEIVVTHSTGADDHQANDHDDRQKQAESPLEVSHFGFPPSKI